MTALGIGFELATSNSGALKLIEARPFDAIITDLGRTTSDENDPFAGLKLLDELRNRSIATPCIVHAGTRAIDQRDRLLAAGASAVINRPTELFDAVIKAIVRSQSTARRQSFTGDRT
jgi:CheY-like chemotaxis protein